MDYCCGARNETIKYRRFHSQRFGGKDSTTQYLVAAKQLKVLFICFSWLSAFHFVQLTFLPLHGTSRDTENVALYDWLPDQWIEIKLYNNYSKICYKQPFDNKFCLIFVIRTLSWFFFCYFIIIRQNNILASLGLKTFVTILLQFTGRVYYAGHTSSSQTGFSSQNRILRDGCPHQADFPLENS